VVIALQCGLVNGMTVHGGDHVGLVRAVATEPSDKRKKTEGEPEGGTE
jgi:hypothetical protein